MGRTRQPCGVDPSVPRHLHLATMEITLGDQVGLIFSSIPHEEMPAINDCLAYGQCRRTLLQDVHLLVFWKETTTLKGQGLVTLASPTPGCKPNGQVGTAHTCSRLVVEGLLADEMSSSACIPNPFNLILRWSSRQGRDEGSNGGCSLRLRRLRLCFCICLCCR